MCILRPGVKGLSERIRVHSLVGRLLEHSRIYRFENAGRPVYAITSADWMTRNLSKRLEILFPIADVNLRRRLIDLLSTCFADNVKARRLLPDGTYQPVERTLKLTRSVLEVLDRFNHPVSIVTKSAGVLRDLDILLSMAGRNLVRVHLSVTTLDAALARVMEPRAATPARRLAAVEALSRAGVPTAVLAAPMIPGLNDAEMERILEAAAKAGARTAGYILLRLPHELKTIFINWLHEHFPDRASHVLQLIRETRAGALNQSKFGQRFSGTGVYADLLARRFARAAKQWGLLECDGLNASRFTVPAGTRAGSAQLSLF